jgi:hypothetical protein
MATRTRKPKVSYLRPVPRSLEDMQDREREEISQALVGALLQSAPRPLVDLDAELLMYAGQYLLHYKESGRSYGSTRDTEHYKLLTPAALKAAFASCPTDSGWLPPGIVRWGEAVSGQYVVMWVQPGKHTISLQELDEVPPEGEQKSLARDRMIEVVLPGMVLAGQGTEWYLWACCSTEFDPKAKLYAAPLPNVGAGGKICWGENKAPRASASGALEAFGLFMNSPFNDHDCNGKSKGMAAMLPPHRRDDIRALLFLLAEEKAPEYPVEDLAQMYLESMYAQVETVIQRLFLGRER